MNSRRSNEEFYEDAKQAFHLPHDKGILAEVEATACDSPSQ